MDEDPNLPQLTDRELEVVSDVVAGYSNHEIALHLNIAEATVKFRLWSIFKKLGVSSRMELALLARSKGIGGAPLARLKRNLYFFHVGRPLLKAATNSQRFCAPTIR